MYACDTRGADWEYPSLGAEPSLSIYKAGLNETHVARVHR
jgi:hypothetical protein